MSVTYTRAERRAIRDAYDLLYKEKLLRGRTRTPRRPGEPWRCTCCHNGPPEVSPSSGTGTQHCVECERARQRYWYAEGRAKKKAKA